MAFSLLKLEAEVEALEVESCVGLRRATSVEGVATGTCSARSSRALRPSCSAGCSPPSTEDGCAGVLVVRCLFTSAKSTGDSAFSFVSTSALTRRVYCAHAHPHVRV